MLKTSGNLYSHEIVLVLTIHGKYDMIYYQLTIRVRYDMIYHFAMNFK